MIRVLNALFDDRYGGPQKRVIEVGARLRNDGVETVLLIPGGSGDTSEIAASHGLKCVHVAISRPPKPRRILSLLWWLLLLPKDVCTVSKVIRQDEIDVVHVNGAFFLAPAFAAKLLKRPLIWHLNDTVVSRSIAIVLGRISSWLADEVIVAADAVAQHYGLAKYRHKLVYAPVDPTQIQKKTLYGGSRIRRVGMIGNWNPLKGLEVFVEMAANVVSNVDVDVEFSVAGSRLHSHARYAAMIDRYILDKKLGRKVHCDGFVKDISAFLNGLDVLVLSSWSEACPIAVLEGMAAGVPVVATDVGGVAEQLSPDTERAAGFVVDPGDAVQMAKRVLDLLGDDDLCRRMGAHGRQAAEGRFSLDSCRAAHLEVYEGVLPRRVS